MKNTVKIKNVEFERQLESQPEREKIENTFLL